MYNRIQKVIGLWRKIKQGKGISKQWIEHLSDGVTFKQRLEGNSCTDIWEDICIHSRKENEESEVGTS
jgi:hypothetical protein